VIIHDMKQGTPEWFAIRAGKITGSMASKLLTPTGKMSASRNGEMGRLIAEKKGWQEPEEFKPSYWMDRGSEMEKEARSWFSVETGFGVKSVGFIEDAGGLAGLSPDGLLTHPTMASKIPLELKVPKPSTHIGWLMEGGLPKEHKQQVHFAMAVMDSPRAYFMSYHPECRPLIVKVEYDDYTLLMMEAIDTFCSEYKNTYREITGEDLES
jgi:hypothetical protein